MRALSFLFFAAVMVVATASPASLEMKDGLAESSTFEPPRQRETLISRPDIAKAKAKGSSQQYQQECVIDTGEKGDRVLNAPSNVTALRCRILPATGEDASTTTASKTSAPQGPSGETRR